MEQDDLLRLPEGTSVYVHNKSGLDHAFIGMTGMYLGVVKMGMGIMARVRFYDHSANGEFAIHAESIRPARR